MEKISSIMHRQQGQSDALRYANASANLQEILKRTPIEVSQALDRKCPFCLNYLIPRIVPVKISGHPPRRQAIFPDRCGCLKEEAAIADEAERRNKIMDHVDQSAWRSQLQNAGLVGWLARATFDSFRSRTDWPAVHEVKSAVELYARELIAHKLNGKPWLVLHGDYGCGKSHLAAAVCHEMLRKGNDRVFFRPWGQYLDQLMATFDREKGEPRTVDILNDLQYGRLVVIDDLDKVPPSRSGWAEGKLFTVLNYRYNAALPTIITLNASPDTMAGPIGDRLRGAAFDSIRFDGPSFRGR